MAWNWTISYNEFHKNYRIEFTRGGPGNREFGVLRLDSLEPLQNIDQMTKDRSGSISGKTLDGHLFEFARVGNWQVGPTFILKFSHYPGHMLFSWPMYPEDFRSLARLIKEFTKKSDPNLSSLDDEITWTVSVGKEFTNKPDPNPSSPSDEITWTIAADRDGPTLVVLKTAHYWLIFNVTQAFPRELVMRLRMYVSDSDECRPDRLDFGRHLYGHELVSLARSSRYSGGFKLSITSCGIEMGAYELTRAAVEELATKLEKVSVKEEAK